MLLLKFIFQVEFEIKLPLAVKDKVTDNDIVENIKNILSEEPVLNEIQFDEEDVFVEGGNLLFIIKLNFNEILWSRIEIKKKIRYYSVLFDWMFGLPGSQKLWIKTSTNPIRCLLWILSRRYN